MEELYENGSTAEERAQEIRAEQQQLVQAAEDGAPMHRIHGDHHTRVGVLRPRNLKLIEAQVLEEARIAGSACYYEWETENSDGTKGLVHGISYDGAMILARLFGDLDIAMKPVQEVKGGLIFTASVTDLHGGTSLGRQFMLSDQYPVYGKMDRHRKNDTRFQIGQSKSIRNAILGMVPIWLKQRLDTEARRGEMDRLKRFIKKLAEEFGGDAEKGRVEAARRLVEALGKEGVEEARVLAKMGRATVEGLTLEDMVILKGNLDALKAQQETVDTLFPKPDGPDPDPGNSGKTRSEEVADHLRGQGTGTPGPDPDPPATERREEPDPPATEQHAESTPGPSAESQPAPTPQPEAAAESPSHGDKMPGDAWQRWCAQCSEWVKNESLRARVCPKCKTPWNPKSGSKQADPPTQPLDPPENAAHDASTKPNQAGNRGEEASIPPLPADYMERVESGGVCQDAARELSYRFNNLSVSPTALGESWGYHSGRWRPDASDDEWAWIEQVKAHFFAKAAAAGHPQMEVS